MSEGLAFLFDEGMNSNRNLSPRLKPLGFRLQSNGTVAPGGGVTVPGLARVTVTV